MNDVTRRRLALLVSQPDQVDELEPAQLPELLGGLEELRVRLELRMRYAPSIRPAPSDAPDTDHLLTAAEVAERLGFMKEGEPDVRKVYRRADRWPFTRRLGENTLRFSERELELWMRKRAS